MTEGARERDQGVGGKDRAAAWLAWSLVELSVVLLVGGVALARTTGSTALELPSGSTGSADSVALLLAMVLTFSVVGAVVAS